MINFQNLPSHIAIIMDGNGRWASDLGFPRIRGHMQGITTIREVTEECSKLGIKVLTLYSFSEENWQRPEKEISFLMSLLKRYLMKELDTLNKNNIRLNVIGNIDKLPSTVKKVLEKTIEETSENKKMDLVLALSYSGREEILNGIKKAFLDKNLNLNFLTQDNFKNYLQTSEYPDPDLLIRTGGEYRLSNFLLWQIAYTELYITSTFWPDFTREELYWSLMQYDKRERRFGRVG